MNKLFYAVKTRFGGENYKWMQRYLQMKRLSDWPFPTDPLKRRFAKYLNTWFRAFFFTVYSVREERNKIISDIYSCLCDLFTSNQSDLLFDFYGVIVPKPQNEPEKLLFTYECLDFFVYYLFNDTAFCDLVCDEGPYELGDVRICMNDIVIDCGANMGLFSAVASQKGATVYAFEPFDYIIEKYLSYTAQLNPNITICKFALSDDEEKISLIQNFENIGGSTISKTSLRQETSDNSIVVQAIPLDTYVERYNIPCVDFIKADIEGAERFLLMGARQVLKEFAPKISICSYHLPDDSKVLKELILDANPNYIIEEKFQKIYAYIKRHN